MKNEYRYVHIGVTLFKVLAWVSLVIQGILGITLLVTGGEAINIAGFDVPARVVGGLNCLAAGIYFFLLYLVSNVLRLLLELRNRLLGETLSGSSGA